MSELGKTIFDRNPLKTVFFIVIISFVLIDIAAGYLLLPRITGTFHAYYHHGLKKNLKIPRKWGGKDYTFHTNSLGLKDIDRKKVASDSNTYRIIFIGDSFTEGVGIPYEKTFVGQVAQNTDKTKIDILNAGTISYSPKLYLLKIEYLLEKVKLKFDELYVFIDISDIQDELYYESFVPSNFAFVKQLDTFLKNTSYTYNKARKYFLNHLVLNKLFQAFQPTSVWAAKDDNIFDELYYKERSKWTYDKYIFKQWGAKGLSLASGNMEKLYSLCKKHGIKMTIAVYPWIDQIERRELNSMQVTYWKDFAESRGIEFMNYFPNFINDSSPSEIISRYFILGDVHWNVEGHELIAKKIIKKINNSDNVPSHFPDGH